MDTLLLLLALLLALLLFAAVFNLGLYALCWVAGHYIDWRAARARAQRTTGAGAQVAR